MWARALAWSVALAAALTITIPVMAGGGPPTDVPTITEFDTGGAIAGDGAAYVHGEDCVRSFYQDRKGNAYMRTVSGQIVCPDVPDGYGGRTVTLDFSNPISGPSDCNVDGLYGDSIDACGVNVIADARVSAELFSGASTTPFGIAFDVSPNPSVHAVQFQLEFLDDLPVTDAGGGARRVSADGTAIARLSVLQEQGRRTRLVEVGLYQMPFGLTMTPK